MPTPNPALDTTPAHGQGRTRDTNRQTYEWMKAAASSGMPAPTQNAAADAPAACKPQLSLSACCFPVIQ